MERKITGFRDWTLEDARTQFYATINSGMEDYMMANFIRCILELHYAGISVDANCPRNPSEDTPLLTAIRAGNVQVVKVLLQFHADPNLCRRCDGFHTITPLHQATCTYPYETGLKIMEVLLEYKASVYSVNRFHETILHYICRNHITDLSKSSTDIVSGKLDKLSLVLNKIEPMRLGDMLNYQNIKGAIPLHVAISFHRCDLAAELIEWGSNLDIQNELGYSSLNWAVLNLRDDANSHEAGEVFGSEYIVARMIKKGANIESKTKSGKTPLCTAINPSIIDEGKENPKEWAIKLLVDNGAILNSDNETDVSDSDSE
jgi:ankyrin repeat protein